MTSWPSGSVKPTPQSSRANVDSHANSTPITVPSNPPMVAVMTLS